MTGYNIVFDPDGKRLGFAKSECNYEEFNAEGNAGIPLTLCIRMIVVYIYVYMYVDDNGDDGMNTADDCSQKVIARLT